MFVKIGHKSFARALFDGFMGQRIFSKYPHPDYFLVMHFVDFYTLKPEL
ncbi:hypothetical protein MRBBS_1575 [Marinobacter sp. BSs20148]|nr:hypothetical protein MRBBS_1575 [Marinobacter sp. BSs20148]